ncbi:DUF485 domain-containing protein [Denitrificimonas sp. JX-1]|uniref:DUF485 domain-containing protein n=1 Tax=Denitrificimonas halotolerans TaxID=3098930 RepID=A0ABU5GT42_9GAMM|nr:DUF485 domain-containing protein [Denitrificimonas sp. JX-1]MDY7220161.1 DUF485 domain-containing protein [Denitrificimonas sp. JX-1]
MQDTVVERVLKHPKYEELVKRRTRVSMIFFAVALVIYSGFILTLAYMPEVFAQPLGAGWTMSVGVFTGILVVLSAVIMISLYVYVSNKTFDPLLEEIVRDVE